MLCSSSSTFLTGMVILFRRSIAVIGSQWFQPMPQLNLELQLLPGEFSVVRLAPGSDLPGWVNGASFCSVTKTEEETSYLLLKAVSLRRFLAVLRSCGHSVVESPGV